jgi:hypothetical protein
VPSVLTVMPNWPTSADSVLLNDTAATRVGLAVKSGRSRWTSFELIELTLTSWPQPPAFMSGSTAWVSQCRAMTMSLKAMSMASSVTPS